MRTNKSEQWATGEWRTPGGNCFSVVKADRMAVTFQDRTAMPLIRFEQLVNSGRIVRTR
jgi:hypothetical protein